MKHPQFDLKGETEASNEMNLEEEAKKKLSEVMREDALKIIKSGYAAFFSTGRWQFEDRSEAIKEPTKCLFSRHKAYMFWFTDDSISIDATDDDMDLNLFESTNYDVKLICYITAAKLGYYIPELTDFYKHKFKKDIESQLLKLEMEVDLYKSAYEEAVEGVKNGFKYKEEGNYYKAECSNCGWWGSSKYLGGGGAIADTGDHFDCYCPICKSTDI